MSYTPTQWATGDVVTAAKLNKMESGIENANEPFVVTVSDSRIPDKSYAEIVAAFEADKEVQLVYSRHVYFLSSVDPSGVSFSYLDQAQTFANVIKIDSSDRLYTASKFFMPPVSAADNGKGLVAKNGAWVKGFPEPFIVHLTPTAQDFSGTMDKTCAEITAAYEAGKDIWFDVDATALGYELWKVQATIVAKVANENYGQAMAFLINITTSPATLIFIFTNFNSDGSSSNYTTRIYPLTSMS